MMDEKIHKAYRWLVKLKVDTKLMFALEKKYNNNAKDDVYNLSTDVVRFLSKYCKEKK